MNKDRLLELAGIPKKLLTENEFMDDNDAYETAVRVVAGQVVGAANADADEGKGMYQDNLRNYTKYAVSFLEGEIRAAAEKVKRND